MTIKDRVFSVLQLYTALIKFRLSSFIVFSALAGYFMAIEEIDLNQISCLILGGFFITGSANTLNQIIERKHDRFMKRTEDRPLASKSMSLAHAVTFAILIGAIGVYFLNQISEKTTCFNLLTKSSLFGIISLIIYVFAYTPLKRVSPISILIGAIPGAIPFLLGWVAATDDFGFSAGVLFAIQFFWQFPHFIAISWILDDQYKNAGFKMMIGSKKGHLAALTSFIAACFVTGVSIISWDVFNLNLDFHLSLFSGLIVFLLGISFCYRNWQFLQKQDDSSAKKTLLSSYIYLSLIQIIYVIDNYLELSSKYTL